MSVRRRLWRRRRAIVIDTLRYRCRWRTCWRCGALHWNHAAMNLPRCKACAQAFWDGTDGNS